ncbi:MAG: tetratricopeptide repeat protein [Acidobacteria bacterium]|nr:tetratricopeptide repeat protein [Acidobacteriota bacterium]
MKYTNLGQSEKAADSYLKAIESRADYFEAHYNLGVTYGALGMYQKAIDSYKRAIRINPDFEEAYRNLGVASGQLGRWQDAVEFCKKALKIKPDDGEVYTTLGLACSMLGISSEAMEAYKQSIKINPNDGDAYYSLGNFYLKLERYDEAVEAYRQATRAKPHDAEAYLNLGITYTSLKRYQEAIEALRHSVGINPAIHEARYTLGLVYLTIGDSVSARHEYVTLRALDQNLANKLFEMIDKAELSTNNKVEAAKTNVITSLVTPASTIWGPSSEGSEGSHALVYVYRTAGWTGRALEPSVLLDDVELVTMDNKRFFSVWVAPGEHWFDAGRGVTQSCEQPLRGQFRAGMVYFLRVELFFGTCFGMKATNPDVAQKDITELKVLNPSNVRHNAVRLR